MPREGASSAEGSEFSEGSPQGHFALFGALGSPSCWSARRCCVQRSWWGALCWLRLEPRVDGLALEREHAEDALVHPGEVLVGYEPVKGLDAESELASGQ